MFMDKRRAITIYIHICLYLHKFCKDIQKLTSLRERNKTGRWETGVGNSLLYSLYFRIKEQAQLRNNLGVAS